MKKDVKPYQHSGEKKAQVTQMFDTIAPRYDFLNIFLTCGIDRLWRRVAVKKLAAQENANILDIATGTGDLAILMSKRTKAQNITGIDLSEQMLRFAQKKVLKVQSKAHIHFQVGDAEHLDFPTNHFDAITVGFGVRNFQNLDKGLSEMHRTLKPGGKALILEFSKPRTFPVKQLYNLYSRTLLPFFGGLASGDRKAYNYLPNSIEAFPDGTLFLEHLKRAGFHNCKQYILSFGIASIYMAYKGDTN